MRIKISHIFVCLFLISNIFAQSKLIYVSEIVRHGARYVAGNIYDSNDTKGLHGQLTSVGMRQHFLLGSYLRNQYIQKLKFISPSFNHSQIEAYSDMIAVDQNRCANSVLNHLLGLYSFGVGEKIPQSIDPSLLQPPFAQISESQNLVKQSSSLAQSQYALNLGFIPIPIRSTDPFFPNCPKEAQIFAKRLQQISKQLAQFQLEQLAFTDKMRLLFNLTKEQSTIFGLFELYDDVNSDLYLGRQAKLPKNFTKQDFLQMRFVQNTIFVSLMEGKLISSLSNTPFLQTVIANMERSIKCNKQNDESYRKFSLFGRHDADIWPLLAFFNVSSHQCVRKLYKNQTVLKGSCVGAPEFASNFIFELSKQSDSNYSVQIKYNGDYIRICQNDIFKCSFQEFKQRLQNQFIDYNKICGVHEKRMSYNSYSERVAKSLSQRMYEMIKQQKPF